MWWCKVVDVVPPCCRGSSAPSCPGYLHHSVPVVCRFNLLCTFIAPVLCVCFFFNHNLPLLLEATEHMIVSSTVWSHSRPQQYQTLRSASSAGVSIDTVINVANEPHFSHFIWFNLCTPLVWSTSTPSWRCEHFYCEERQWFCTWVWMGSTHVMAEFPQFCLCTPPQWICKKAIKMQLKSSL